jgi:hypothetical protein
VFVLRVLRGREIVKRRATQAQQFALADDRDLGMCRLDLLPLGQDRSFCDFFLSQSNSTLSWPICR